MAIMKNQNQGKLAESASFQAQLQQNLMILLKLPMQSHKHRHLLRCSKSNMFNLQKLQPGFLAPKFPFRSSNQQQPMYLQQQQINHPQGMQTGFGNIANSAYGQQ